MTTYLPLPDIAEIVARKIRADDRTQQKIAEAAGVGGQPRVSRVATGAIRDGLKDRRLILDLARHYGLRVEETEHYPVEMSVKDL